MNRRHFLLSGAAAATTLPMGLGIGNAKTFSYPPPAGGMAYEVTKSDPEWKAILTENQFKILRQEKTERPNTSPLNMEKRAGLFHCAGCDLAVYSSETKFDSGTGWPSFYDNIKDAVRTKEDNTLFSTRTEVHCRRCGGHFGHIFEDGPEPTGLRHCLNGAALKFVPQNA
ncbi:MAG: peptide-methionine (R)-S-oxide reductase MsrB [Rhodobacteraceae bacterium]|nr:peptide-methionine (R)-S-oxide reductase MsrB [Paracoccaceae bacterium]